VWKKANILSKYGVKNKEGGSKEEISLSRNKFIREEKQ
jgi:hypothetical protein